MEGLIVLKENRLNELIKLKILEKNVKFLHDNNVRDVFVCLDKKNYAFYKKLIEKLNLKYIINDNTYKKDVNFLKELKQKNINENLIVLDNNFLYEGKSELIKKAKKSIDSNKKISLCTKTYLPYNSNNINQKSIFKNKIYLEHKDLYGNYFYGILIFSRLMIEDLDFYLQNDKEFSIFDLYNTSNIKLHEFLDFDCLDINYLVNEEI